MKYLIFFFILLINLVASPTEALQQFIALENQEQYKKLNDFFVLQENELSKEEAKQFAFVLQRILHKKTPFVQETKVFVSYPVRQSAIYLVKKEEKWLFSKATKKNIAQVYNLASQQQTPQKAIAYYLQQVSEEAILNANSCFTIKSDLTQEMHNKFADVLRKAKGKLDLTQEQIASFNDGNIAYALVKDEYDDWHFTDTTKRNILNNYKKISRDSFKNIIPSQLHPIINKIQELWYLGLLVIILATFFTLIVIHKLIKYIFHRFEFFQTNKHRYLSMFILAMIWYWLFPLINLSEAWLNNLQHGALLLATICGVICTLNICDAIAKVFIEKANKSANKVDDVLVPMIHKMVRLLIYIIGFVLVASKLGFNIQGILAGLGLGGLAFALAAKDTIENVFGSVTVLLDRPFEVGDWVVVDDIEGTVEEISLRSTKIRTFYNSLVNVPNSILIKAKVDNYGRRKYRRIKTFLSLSYDTKVDKITEFCQGIEQLIEKHPLMRKDYYQVYFNKFSASSLDVLLYCFIECDDWGRELKQRQELFLDILSLAKKLEVEFAYPTQTINLIDKSK